jgi:hypothetical protein
MVFWDVMLCCLVETMFQGNLLPPPSMETDSDGENFWTLLTTVKGLFRVTLICLVAESSSNFPEFLRVVLNCSEFPEPFFPAHSILAQLLKAAHNCLALHTVQDIQSCSELFTVTLIFPGLHKIIQFSVTFSF